MDKLYRKHRHCPVHLAPGLGPHAYRLVCTKHGKTLRWLNNNQAQLVKEALDAQAAKS